MAPTLLELADFRAVALLLEEGSVRRAAARFGATQPALSMRLQRIEAKLGQPLFLRGSAGLQATAAGTRLGRHAWRVLREAAQAEGAAIAPPASGKLPARLAVGMTPCAEGTTLPLLMRRLPGVELSVRTLNGVEQAAALRAGRIDLGLAYLPMRQRGLVTREMARYTLLCALPARHPAARGPDPVPLDRLVGVGFLLFSAALAPELHARYVALLAKWQLPACGTHETDRIETLLGQVGQGRGAALVPSWAAAQPVDGVVFRRLPTPLPVAMGAVVARREAGEGLLAALGENPRRADPPLFRRIESQRPGADDPFCG